MKRILYFVIAFFLIVNIAGCASVQRKFTRKKKETVKMPHIYQVKKYEKKPTPELYKKHYVYWESFHSEMLMTLGQNHRKDMVYIEHILSNLHDMQNMLMPDKATELELHIKRLTQIKDILAKEDLSKFNKTYVMTTLERESRYIKRGFIYGKVKNNLRTSFDEEPKGTVEVPKGQEVVSGQSQPAE